MRTGTMQTEALCDANIVAFGIDPATARLAADLEIAIKRLVTTQQRV